MTDAAGYASASAVDYTAITARLNNVGGVTLEQKFTAQASNINGLYGQYTLKVDVNGRVSGFGLASTGTASTFIINADKFAISRPGSTGNDILPFVVDTTDGNKVVMDGAFIKNATINTAAIGNAVITSAKMVDASITTAKIADASITGAKITNATITGAKITDATITGAKIEDAAITTAKIASVIQSTNYFAGTDGWKIEKSGKAEFNGVVITRPNVVAYGTWLYNNGPGVGGPIYPDGDAHRILIDSTYNSFSDIASTSNAVFIAKAKVTHAVHFGGSPGSSKVVDISTSCVVQSELPYYATGAVGAPGGRLVVDIYINARNAFYGVYEIWAEEIEWSIIRLT